MMGKEIATRGEEPRTVAEWQSRELSRKQQNSRLSSLESGKRAANLSLILETFSVTMSIFGWSMLDPLTKKAAKKQWCKILWDEDLGDVEKACERYAQAMRGKSSIALNAFVIQEEISAIKKAQVEKLGGYGGASAGSYAVAGKPAVDGGAGFYHDGPDKTPQDIARERANDDDLENHFPGISIRRMEPKRKKP